MSSGPGQVVDPADGVDVLLDGPLLENIVAQVEHRELVVDEDRLRQELQVAVGQVRGRRQLVRCLSERNSLKSSDNTVGFFFSSVKERWNELD